MNRATTNQSQLQTQLLIEFDDDEIKRREIEIAKIESLVSDIHSMMEGVNSIVLQQGHLIDNIETNVEKCIEHSNEGVRELGKAEKHLRDATCIIQ